MQVICIDSTLATQVLAIARTAGEAIMRIQLQMRSGSQVLLAHKADSSPLTQADLQAHQLVSRALAALTPGVPVVSEEDTQNQTQRCTAAEFWLIDPLDGTKEFLAQSDEFTVNIALVRQGEPVFGVVLAPALAQAYWGGRGLGAFRHSAGQTQPIHVAGARTAGQLLRVVASKSHMNNPTVEFIAKLGAHELIQAGSSLKFCRIAEGAADIYPRLGPTCEWDTAAAQAIVEAAGGHVTQLDGQALRYGKPDVLNPFFVASASATAVP